MPASATELVHGLTAHRGALLDLFPLLSEEHGKFAPWEGGMTIKGTLDHLNGTSSMLLAIMKGEAPQRPAPSGSLQEAIEKFKADTEALLAGVGTLSDEDLQRLVPAFGGQMMPLGSLVHMIRDHDIHHKGQLWLMARMVGIKPPMFVKR